MWHLLSDSKPWFRAKTYGYGAGLPVTWQGWVLTLSYVAAMIGLGVLAGSIGGYALAGAVAIMIVLTLAFVFIVKAHTDREWHWRWGEDD